MKKINKQESPQWFEDWKEKFELENGKAAHYKDDFSTNDQEGAKRRRELREHLVDEQGRICRLSLAAKRIETTVRSVA